MNKKFKILSISGGGIRGIIPSSVLSELEANTGQKIYELFDLIVGTSTGGIIASSLSYGYEAKEITNLYLNEGFNIFDRSFLYKITSGFGLLKSKYPSKGIQEVIKKFLDDKHLFDSKIDFMTTAYNTTLQQIKLFKSWKEEDKIWTFADVALATSAAPTYFPSYTLSNDNYIDGGIYANSPVEIGWIEGIKKGYKPEDIVILSLGTGEQKQYVSYNTDDWGIKNWLKKKNDTPLLDMVFDGIKEKDHYITGLLFDNFYHLDTIISDKYKMDTTDPKLLLNLAQIGKNLSKSLKYSEFLNNYIYGKEETV